MLRVPARCLVEVVQAKAALGVLLYGDGVGNGIMLPSIYGGCAPVQTQHRYLLGTGGRPPVLMKA